MTEPGYPPAKYWAKVAVVVVLVLALLVAAWAVRGVLLLVLVAAVLAIGLDPAVRRLQRFKISRGWAVLVIFLATLGFIALFGFLVIPPLVREVRELAQDIPGYVERLQRSSGWIGDLQRRFDLSSRLQQLTERLPTAASASIGAILGVTRGIASMVFQTLTIAILTVYFLLGLPRGRRLATALLPKQRREQHARSLDEALDRVGGYVSGNLVISAIAGVSTFIALQVIGVPFAAALAMWVAFADLIPSVGATLGAVLVVIVASFSSLGDAVAAAIFHLVYQQVENYVIAPRVMRRAVDLSPAAVIVSVLIGATLAGFAGALLALPVAAAAKVFVWDLWLGERLADVSEQPGAVALTRKERRRTGEVEAPAASTPGAGRPARPAP